MQDLHTNDQPQPEVASNGAPEHNGAATNGYHDSHEVARAEATRELTSEIDRLRHWHFWSGPLVTLVVSAGILLVDQFLPSSNPGILLVLPVLYSIFSGGIYSGLISTVIAAIALNFHYPPSGPSLHSLRYMTWDIAGLILVLAVGERLRRFSYRARLTDKLNRQLRYEIHERSRIERELREQRDSFEDFVENGTIGMHWVGPDGTILWVNQAELDMLGYTHEEYVGHNITEFHADQDVITDILARLERDETLLDETARMVAKDGSIRHVLINSNVRREDGRFINTRCFTRDVTKQHWRDVALRQSERLFKTIADNLPVALYTTDESGVITFYNEKAAEAWGRHPVVGEDLWCGSWKIYWPDGSDCPLDECPMAIALKERRPAWGHEIVIEREDGSRIWAQPFPTPVYDEQGNFSGALNLILDVTDRKHAEDSLHVAQAEEQRVSHELNQLSQISRVLAESRNLKEAARDVLRTICELTDGATAALWLTEKNGSLRCVDVVCQLEDGDEFVDVTRNMIFKAGSGLPGRVLSTGAPAWIYDVGTDSNFPRRPYAQRVGLGSAFAFPLKSGDAINGVIEIFYHGKRQFDEARLGGVAEVGTRIGIFVERQIAEDAMRDSEQRFRAIFEQAGVGVVQSDVDGKILAANERYCEMIGYTKEEVVGRKLLEFTHPEDRGKYIYQLGLLWAGEIERLHIEKRNIRRDGARIWVSKTMSLVRDEQGDARYTLAVVQDVTERYEAQQVIREQQDYLRAVLSSSPITLAAIDTEGTYRVFIGNAMEPIGTTAENRLGRTIYEAQYKDPEAINHYKRALSGETLRLRREVQGLVFEMTFAPYRGPDGEIVGAIALASDVTDIARVDAALRESEERFRNLIMALPTAVYTTDKDGFVTLFNEKAVEIWGRRPEIGKDRYCGCTKAYSKDGSELAVTDAPMAQALATGKPVHGEEVIIERPDGSRRFVMPYPEPLLDINGEVTGAVNVLVDITERKEAETALLASESRLRTTLENAPLILTEIAIDGTIEMIIGRGMKEAGANADDSVGQSVYDRNKDTPERIELFERALAGEEINYTLAQDGLAFNTFIGPRRNAQGEVTGVVGVLTNISDLYQTQRELRERDRLLQMVSEKAPIILAHLDDEGNYKQFLGQTLSSQGVNAETRVGRSIREVYPLTHPLREVYERTLTGEGTEATLDLPGGRVFHVVGVPNRDDADKVTDVILLGVDMTPRLSAERELRRNQAFLSTVLDGAPLILTLIDRDGTIRLSMGSSLTHKGLPVQELMGKSIHKLYGENPEHVKLFERALSGESYRIPLKLGDVTYQVSARPYYDEQGEISGVLSLALDITDLKDTEEMLREREHQLTAILDNTPLTLAMHDAEGRRTMIVGKLIKDLGIDPEPYIGKSVFEEPDADPQVVEAMRKALRGEASSFELAALERVFHVFFTPRTNDSGEVIGAISAAMDISDRVAVDNALRQSEERFRVISDAAPVLIWMSGPDHGGTWFNKAWLEFTGRTLEQELGNGWVAGIHPDDKKGCLEICLGAFEHHRPFQMIFRLRRHDGEYRQVLDSATPMFNAAGEFQGFIGSCTDITDHADIPSAIPGMSITETKVEASNGKVGP